MLDCIVLIFYHGSSKQKRELQRIAQNHSSNISNKDLIIMHKNYTAKPYSFLVYDTKLTSDNRLSFRKNVFNT